MRKTKIAGETQNVRSRPDDKKIITIPDLRKNENDMFFIVAAINGAMLEPIQSLSNRVTSPLVG
jgi:hypothetical protein